MKLANIVFQDLKKEYSDFVLISPQGGMNHFGNEFDNIKKGGVPFEVNDKTLYIVSSYAEGHLEEATLQEIHDKFNQAKIPLENVLLVQSNYNLKKQYDDFCFKNEIKDRINILITEHKLESCVESFQQLKNGEWDLEGGTFPKIPSINMWSDVEDVSDRDFYFLSYNKTLRPDRVALLSMMYKNDLISKGLVSIGSKDYGSIGKQPWPNDFDFIVDNSDDVKKWSKKLQKLQPLSADGEPQVEELDEGKYKHLNVCAYTYGDQFRRVYYMVVTEDVFNSDSMFFSQTTYKPIVSLTPFIMFGSPHMMRNLREEQGFKTFSPWIDESYDDEENHEKRLFMIIEEIKRLCNMKKTDMDKWYKEMKDVLIYNQNHLLNYELSDYDKIYEFVENKYLLQ